MKPFVKAIIAGGCVILIGVIILLVALGLNGWKFKANFTTEEFVAEQENKKVVVENSIGTVKISGPSPKWYEFSIWWADVPEMAINLPKATAFDLTLTVNAGSLRLLEGEYSAVHITVNAGVLNANGVECDTFKATVNAGSMQINNLNCHTSFDGEVNAGSLNAKGVTCPKISAEVNAGSLSMKINGVKSEYTIHSHVSAGSSNISSQTGSTDK